MEKILVNPEILWPQFEEMPAEKGKELDHDGAFSFTISGTEVINPISIIVSKVTEEFNEHLMSLDVEQLLIEWNEAIRNNL